tara:strand:- start:26 stop:757 length:732 start_codon:yes stop_codon:yes gene_type:complete
MDYRISTITCISELSNYIDLHKLYTNLEINDNIKYIEYGIDKYKGYAKKRGKKSRKSNKKKTFFNQLTIHLYYNKLINIKLFNNGKIQLTGINNISSITNIILLLIKELSNKDIIDAETKILNYKIVLINSDFDIGYKVNREVLYRYMIENNIFSTYEPCTYPGVNIKYYFNNNNNNTGICQCDSICHGKLDGNGNNRCKKITIAVFKSGKIIITGGQNIIQVNSAFKFINNILINNYKLFKI